MVALASRIIVVTGARVEGLNDYLYSHTQRILTIEGEGRDGRKHFVAFLETMTYGDDIEYTARYQTDRLNSGLYGARMFQTYSAAFKDKDVRYWLEIAGQPQPELEDVDG